MIMAEDMKPTSWVFPPAEACTLERERLPAAVKELKKQPTMLIKPRAMNSCTENKQVEINNTNTTII